VTPKRGLLPDSEDGSSVRASNPARSLASCNSDERIHSMTQRRRCRGRSIVTWAGGGAALTPLPILCWRENAFWIWLDCLNVMMGIKTQQEWQTSHTIHILYDLVSFDAFFLWKCNTIVGYVKRCMRLWVCVRCHFTKFAVQRQKNNNKISVMCITLQNIVLISWNQEIYIVYF
jgi:hypothetical protein